MRYYLLLIGFLLSISMQAYPKASEKDEENAIKYYRNKQDYPHANPDAVLEVMYLGADGNFKRKNY